jgi:iron complex transport system substrate-binding protein
VRVVSLLPSATEIVHYLGCGSMLVGRSAECDYPEEVQALPAVMRPKVSDADRPSGEIDARVRAAREHGESLYWIDVPLLGSLQPDVILTQDLCGVCSVTGDEIRAACRSAHVEARIVSLTPHSLSEIRRDIRTVAEALGAEVAGSAAELDLNSRQAAVENRASDRRPSVAVVEWLDPPILAGLWSPEMVALAGGRPLPGMMAGRPAARSSWEELRADPPELMILSPCSFSVDRTFSELARAPLARLPEQFPTSEIWVADEAYFSRPGPRLWQGLELVADLIDRVEPRAPMPVRRWSAAPVEAAP